MGHCLLAHEAVGRDGALDQVVFDGVDDALVGSAPVGGVTPAFDGDEHARGELAGQALRHRVGGGRVVGRADHDDGGGALRGDGVAVGVAGGPGGQRRGGVADVSAEDRQFALEGGGLADPLLGAAFGLVVQVVDRVDGVSGVVRVGAVGVARVHQVGDRKHRGAVALLPRGGERLGELGPARRVVHGPRHGGDGEPFGQGAIRVVGSQWVLLEGFQEGSDGGDALFPAVSHGARGLGGAVADPLLERGVESAHLERGDFVDAERGVQGAVEDEAADALGEEAGVGGAEEGAVGVAEEVEGLLAEHRAHHVEVARGADGVDVFEEAAGAGAASVGEGAGVFLHLGDRGLRVVVGGVSVFAGVAFVAFLVRHAEDGGGGADAARVEGDDVVGLDDGFTQPEGGVVGQRGDDGAAGAAGVDEEDGGVFLPGAVDGQGEGDLVAVGVRPVEGRFEEGALVFAGVGGVDAFELFEGAFGAHAPRDGLFVVRLGGPGLDGDRRGRGRGCGRGDGSPGLGPVVADDGQDDSDDGEDRDGCDREGACLHGPDCIR